MDQSALELIATLRSEAPDDQKILDAIELLRKAEKSKSFNHLFELSFDLICMLDTNGALHKVSQSFSQALGYSPEELLLHPLTEFIPDTDKLSASEALMHFRKGVSRFQFECRCLTKDGQTRWFTWRAVTLPGEDLAFVIGRDVTSQKESIERLKTFTVQLHEYQKDHLQSLEYARMLQGAIMPDPESLKRFFPDAFIFYQPKDIVSGDFFWFDNCNDKIFVAAADCTGHGVPGALLSILGFNTLHSTLQSDEHCTPAALLKKIDETFDKYLGRKFGTKTMTDAMDISICMIDRSTRMLHFSGANNPLYLVRAGEVIRLEASRYSLGSNTPGFAPATQTLQLRDNDMIYLLSDGYIDQFGGDDDRRLGTRRFRELLLSVAGQSTEMQKTTFAETWEKWKGSGTQTDDILLIGLRI